MMRNSTVLCSKYYKCSSPLILSKNFVEILYRRTLKLSPYLSLVFFSIRKKNKDNKDYGFSLIEVVVALLISSIIGIALFTSFNQINKYATIANNVMNVDTRLVTIHHQLTKDIAGACIVVQALPPEDKKKDNAEKKTTDAAQQKSAAPEKPAYKQLKKIFVSTNGENDVLKSLTFITNNPLISYGNSKPRIARVMYRLAQDKNKKEIFTLYRQESTTELEAEKFKPDNKKIREFMLADNIKHLSISYEAPQEDSDELDESKEWDSDKKIQKYVKQKQAREKKSAKKNKTDKDAQASTSKEADKKTDKKEVDKDNEVPGPFYVLPQYATFELDLWETTGKGSISSKGMIFIPACAIIEPPKPQEKQPEKNTPQGPPLPPSIVKLFGPGVSAPASSPAMPGAAAPAPVSGGK